MKFISIINILCSYASIENITIASNDTIYFYQDVFSFHTKSGIAIKRNIKNLLYERDNKTKEIFKNAYFNHIINNGYTFVYNIDN